MRQQLLQEAGSGLPFPSLPLQWPGPGPRVWKSLVSQQFPSGCRVTAGDRSTLKGSLHSSGAGNAGKAPLIHSASSACQALPGLGIGKGHVLRQPAVCSLSA